MTRKKLSEMTPYERVDSRMKGMSWEEAEEVGVEILARCMALHVYVRKEDDKYMKDLLLRICKKADEWAHTDNGLNYLAMASLGYGLMKTKEDAK